MLDYDKIQWTFENTREMKKKRATGGCFLHFSSVLKCPNYFIEASSLLFGTQRNFCMSLATNMRYMRSAAQIHSDAFRVRNIINNVHKEQWAFKECFASIKELVQNLYYFDFVQFHVLEWFSLNCETNCKN